MANKKKVKLVLVQLGSPKAPTAKDLRVYLKEFLGDPRVIDINPYLWKIILNLFVLPFRPAKSAKLYERIWDGKSFPLITNSWNFTHGLQDFFKKDQNKIEGVDLEIDLVFILSEPRFGHLWDEWEKEDPAERASKWIVLPIYPQYSEATTAGVMDMFFKELSTRAQIPAFEFINNFHNSKAFIDNSVAKINQGLKENEGTDLLVISFHGIPTRRVLVKKDPYYQQCYETYLLLKKGVKGIPEDKILFTFQSRFGSEQWLGPYTDEKVIEMIEEGHKKVGVYCPSFVADCLETTDEIGNELAEEAEEVGGEVYQIPCLNSDPKWIDSFGRFVKSGIEDPTGMEKESYPVTKEELKHMPEQKLDSPPLTPEAKGTLKIVFLTLFLDLIGFSIIFPLFPALAQHYLEVDSQNFFLQAIFNPIKGFASVSEGTFTPIVLFGGALGALYSLLQFIAAPIWGSISDKIGRRPVLLISVFGLALSYLLWFFSGSFTLLIAARFIGGIMGGNISTATAVVADITQKENRSKGMAIIGIAFAFGFILGPALGGIFSLWDLTKIWPELKELGVNPFSLPALVAFLLGAFNFVNLARKFKETLPPEKRNKQKEQTRSINPLKLFKPLPYKGVNLTNFGHFLFLMAFSGMEFTLTFLAVERLGYSSLDNAYMFIFIGLIIALVQGGFVRRKAAQIGEKKVSVIGLLFLVPGLLLIGFTKSSWLLYAGLFFLAVGSSMVIPCLTALVSLYTPAEEQGKSIGIFRSLGALARVLGPIFACVIYWKWGSSYPYFIGAAFLLIPLLLVAKLPNLAGQESKA